METQSNKIRKVVEDTFKEIKKRAPQKYEMLEADPAKMKQIRQAVEATARESVLLNEEFAGHPQDIAKRLTKHLPVDRIKKIQGALHIPTFQVKIIWRDDGMYDVKFIRDGKELYQTRTLASCADVDWATILQYSSMLIEAVLLVMSAVGIAISPSAKVIEKTVDETADAIKNSSQMQRALDAFVKAWAAAGSNPVKMATAMFNLIKDTYAAGILWTIVESLCSNMAWYDWLEVAASVTAMIIAALASGGAALIAKIALVVLKAVDFAVKIANIVAFSDIKASL